MEIFISNELFIAPEKLTHEFIEDVKKRLDICIHICIELFDEEEQKILKVGDDIISRKYSLKSRMDQWFSSKDEKEIKEFIREGINVNIENEYGENLFYILFKDYKKNKDLLSLLIDEDINIQPRCVLRAIESDSCGEIDFLIRCGLHDEILFRACERGNIKIIKKFEKSIHKENIHGETPLDVAIKNNDKNVIVFLLKKYIENYPYDVYLDIFGKVIDMKKLYIVDMMILIDKVSEDHEDIREEAYASSLSLFIEEGRKAKEFPRAHIFSPLKDFTLMKHFELRYSYPDLCILEEYIKRATKKQLMRLAKMKPDIFNMVKNYNIEVAEYIMGISKN